MSAEECLKTGRPAEALELLQDAVRKDPADPKLRVFLFQLLAVLGQWDRASNQLTVAGEMDPGNLAMVQTYRLTLRCEVLRAEVFAGNRTPLVFGRPPPWLALQLQALEMQAKGRSEQAAKVRQQAFADAPATPGKLDGAAFSWLADADMRLGPVLEGIVNGSYYWIPFDRIRRIQLEAPSDLRDLVWTPAHFMWSNGGEAFGFVPTRYPSTEAQADGQLQLARRTQWQEAGAETYLGLGQRILSTDNGDHALLDLRLIEIDSPTGEEEPDMGDAWLTQKERIQPSLLDRLTDDAPGERRESRQQRVLSMRQLRESVVRDLGWLLNTTWLEAAQDLTDFPHAKHSVINFGIPDLTGHTATNVDAASLERMLRRSIEAFEPRFKISSVKVRRGGDSDQMTHNALRFDIEGEVWAQPLPLRIFLKTELDLELGSVDIQALSA